MNVATVPLVQMPRPVPMQAMPSVTDPALLQARPQGLMVEYTSRCNLRCKYCSKSNPGDDQIPGRDMDMPANTLEQTLALIARERFSELLLAGTGESTFHKDWVQDLPRLIAAGKAANPNSFIHINSNFALKYGEAELAVLAQLDGIMISIDTADRDLTRTVRSKSDLSLIVYNILRLKTWCTTHGVRMPRLTVNATVYAEAAEGVYDLAVMLAELPIQHLSLSDLYEFEAVTVNNIRPIGLHDPARFVRSVETLQKAINFAQTAKRYTLSVQPHLIERINQLVAQLNTGESTTPAAATAAPAGRRTKMCTQPWTRFTVAANGSIFPCCVTDMPPVGNLHRPGEGLDGPDIRAFRQALLEGRVPPACQACSNAADCSTDELEAQVRGIVAHS
ncbi:radical SAM protein [Roseateles sp. BYS87W]|uniref:Radical SAM protein n=1 Tax=Pelomonas baiyunensis TaxID=3299026 RepID=A0ABW7GXG6_9BURK